MEPQEIVSRLDVLVSNRTNVEAIWNKVDRYIMPLRLGDFFQKPQSETSTNWDRDEIYDNTAMNDAQTMAANVHGAMTNPQLMWLGAKWKMPALNDDMEAARWLDIMVETLYAELYESNFDSEVGSAFQDLIGCGTTCMSLEPEREVKIKASEWEGFNFQTYPLREIYFEQDHRGRLAVVYRLLSWTPRMIQTKCQVWGVEPPEEIKKLIADSASVDVRIDVVYCVYARETKWHNRGEMFLASSERPYGSKYILRDMRKELGVEQGLYEMPAFVARWDKTSGSMWGFGPGILAAPTEEYINNWMMYEDIAARKQIDQPMLVNERGLMSDLNQQPGGLTLVRDVEKSVKPLASNPGGMDLSMKKLDELRAQVSNTFKKNELQMPTQGPQMSSAEAQIRYQLLNRVLGPSVGRIENELLHPMMHRGARLLLRNKQLPPVPEIVKKLNAQFAFVFGGPLARAQKVDEATSVERWIGSLAGAAKVLPKITNVINQNAVGRGLGDMLGVPPKYMNSDAEIAALAKQQDELQLQMAKAQAAQASGEGAQALAQGQAAQNAQQPAPGQA